LLFFGWGVGDRVAGLPEGTLSGSIDFQMRLPWGMLEMRLPSGAKAQRLFSATCGTAEAVPFQNFGHLVVFPQPVKPIVDLIGFIGMRPRPRGFPGTPVVPFQNFDLIRGSLSASIEASEGLETLRTADLEIGATNLRIGAKEAAEKVGF